MAGRTIGEISRNLSALGVLAAALLAAAPEAEAVPSFARQTGMACEACHTVYPELTHFGRVFKANGYILSNVKQVRDVTGKKEELLSLAQTVPLSIMAQVDRPHRPAKAAAHHVVHHRSANAPGTVGSADDCQ